MKQKINLRLTLIALIAVLSTTIGITVVFYNIFQNRVQTDLKINSQLLAATGFFQKPFKEAEIVPDSIDSQALKTLDSEEMRITWIDDDGTVLYDNDTDVSELDNHLGRPEIIQAIETGSGQSVRKSDTLHMNTFYYAIKLDDGTILRVATKARSITSVFLSSLPIIIIIIATILALCVVLGHMLTTQLIRPIYTMAEHLDDKGGTLVYSELQPFATKIRNQHEKILEAAKSRQDFTANISHELKTPLTAISGYAELIENRMVNSEQEVSMAKEIRNNANRLLLLINDIIRLSELDHSELKQKFEHVNLYKLTEDCCKALRINAEQKEVALSCVGTNTMMIGDRELLKELVENLVQNSIRYNKANGWVRVKVTVENNRATLTVSDNGIGIPKEHQDRVFERFYRVDKSRSKETGGTGLGLAIVKHIVELHEGEIKLESEYMKGTVVTVSF